MWQAFVRRSCIAADGSCLYLGERICDGLLLMRRVLTIINDAGWSSKVARWAHNPRVAGSNPAPATNPVFLNNHELRHPCQLLFDASLPS